MGVNIDYFFAPHSPWAYLGHARFAAMAAKYGAAVTVKPFDIGKVFSVSGGLPLAKRAPQRQAYRLVELARWSKHLDVPLVLQPKVFPVAFEAAAKLIIATRIAHGTEAAMDLSGSIMRALWADERNIGDPEVLVLLAGGCDLDGRMLQKSSETAAVQSEYDANTDQAIAANVFGVPWYVVDGEAFWGQDRLEFVERAIQQHG